MCHVVNCTSHKHSVHDLQGCTWPALLQLTIARRPAVRRTERRRAAASAIQHAEVVREQVLQLGAVDGRGAGCRRALNARRVARRAGEDARVATGREEGVQAEVVAGSERRYWRGEPGGQVVEVDRGAESVSDRTVGVG